MRWNLQKLPMLGLQGVECPLEALRPTFDQRYWTKFPEYTSVKIDILIGVPDRMRVEKKEIVLLFCRSAVRLLMNKNLLLVRKSFQNGYRVVGY
jgi:hypothetical protein